MNEIRHAERPQLADDGFNCILHITSHGAWLCCQPDSSISHTL